MQKKYVIHALLLLFLVAIYFTTKGQVPAQIAQPTAQDTSDLLPIEDGFDLTMNSTQDQPMVDPIQILKTSEKQKHHKQKAKKEKTVTNNAPDISLDFDVENKTGKTVYVACLAYMKKGPLRQWHWDKSDIYKIEDNNKVTIAMHPIEDEQDRTNTFGYLAVLDTQKAAEDAVYELLPDSNKIELDLLVHLKGKTVLLEVEKYGINGEFLEYDFVSKDKSGKINIPELDFIVENRTGKTILVTGFIFEKRAKGTWLAEKTKEAWTAPDESRDDMSPWRFDKTPLITLKPGESGIIDVDTIIESRDRKDVQGFLAVFDEDERQQAEDAVYEQLPVQNKLQLGKLSLLKNKKIIIEIEKYGSGEDLIDFTVKPVTRIDFSTINKHK